MGRAIIGNVLASLHEQGIRKCNIYVLDDNRWAGVLEACGDVWQP
jgi:hypothetical protein